MRYRPLALVLAIAPVAYGDLVTNGGFDSDRCAGGLTTASPSSYPDTALLPGWSIDPGRGGQVDYLRVDAVGGQDLDLSAVNTGRISQALATTSGVSYTRRFYTAGSGGGDAVGPLGVAAGGNSANLASAAAASPTGDMRWQLGALASAAASASTPLGFPGLADDADGRALDGVSVDATVPEPATILLFAAGLAALGLWRRAHRKKSRATTP